MPVPPTYPGVYVEELPGGARAIPGVPTSITAFVGRARCGPIDSDDSSPVRIVSFAEYERVFGGLWAGSPMSFAVHHYFRNGGSEALIVRVHNGADAAAAEDDGDVVGAPQIADPALRASRRGLFALDKADLFNLLCIPPFSPTADVDKPTWDAAVAYATERRAMVLVDPPYIASGWHAASDATAPGAVTAVVGRSENAALFFPRIRVANPLDGNRPEPFAPSGAIAGVIARTDRTRGVWKSPAGSTGMLDGVLGFTVNLTDAENGAINQLGVNCLRHFPNTGPVVWGARTLAGADSLASQWKYIAVRRLTLFLEESLSRGTTWAAFEPNDERLWARIRQVIDAFLQGLFRQGAFQGRSSREAYFVKCGRETMTPADIRDGLVNIVVGLRAAHAGGVRDRQDPAGRRRSPGLILDSSAPSAFLAECGVMSRRAVRGVACGVEGS